jgi:putative ABC transport system permease protein
MINRAYWRFLVQSPWSTLLATFGVALGVVSIVSVHLVSVQISEQLQQLGSNHFSGVTHLLHRDEVSSEHYFDLRRQWRSGQLEEVTQVSAFVDEELMHAGQRIRVIGVDLLSQGLTGDLTSLVSSQPSEPFSWRGVWLSDGVEPFPDYPVNGQLSIEAPTVIADIGIAQELLGLDPEDVSYIGIAVPASWARVRNLLDRLLPGAAAGLPASTPRFAGLAQWQLTSLDHLQPANRFAQSILFNVSALATLAILVAWFLIYQVAVTWLRRLRGVFTRLHTLGVSNGAIMLRFLALLGGLGVVASLIGVVAGWALARWLLAVAVGGPLLDVALDSFIIGKALVSAVGVCVVGGWLAYRQQTAEPSLWLAVALFVGLLMVCLLGIVWPATGLAGAFGAIAALSFIATLTMRPILDRLRTASRYFAGDLLRRLSARELFWYPRDLSVAMGGLVLAVATAMGVGLMVDSFRGDFSQMLERRLTYDIVVDGSSADLAKAAAAIDETDGVLFLQRYVTRDKRVDGISVQATQTDVNEFEAKRYGLARALVGDEVLVSEQLRQVLATRGDRIVIGDSFDDRTIAGIFRSFGDTQPRAVMAFGAADDAPTSLAIRLHPSAEFATVLAVLQRHHAELKFTPSREIKANALATFDQTFTITSILITIALLVAGTGIYIANQALRLNKAASTELLDMMGVTSGEAWMMDFTRSLFMGLTAVLLALPLGVSFAWILCEVVNPRAFGWSIDLRLDVGAIVYPVLWGVIASVVAGLIRLGVNEEARFGDLRAAS